MKYIALLRQLLAPAPAEPAAPPARVHRGEVEFSSGCDHLGEEFDPPAKLTPDEVERMCGRPLRVLA